MPDSPDHAPERSAGSRRSVLSRSRRAERRATRRRAAVAGALAGLALVAAALAALALRPPAPESPPPAAASGVATPSPVATTAVEPTASVEPTPSAPPTITVSAVGDMIFDRQVRVLIQSSGGGAPLARVAARLAAADVAVGNLESPLSTRGTRAAGKEVCFRGDPRGIEGLEFAGFDALSVANNHALDYGAVALADTLEALDTAGIAHSGAGADKAAAWEPAYVRAREATVAYLAFSHILPAGFVATDARAGIAQGRANMKAVQRAISQAAERSDYVLVSFHWGVEYEDDANADQVRDARLAIDAGADMVLAHHPHVIQGVERYGDGLIAYSLGDFVFDHYSRKTGEAFILDIELGPHGVGETTVTPVYLDRYGRPGYVKGEEAAVILRRLRSVSAKHGTAVEIDGDIARVPR